MKTDALIPEIFKNQSSKTHQSPVKIQQYIAHRMLILAKKLQIPIAQLYIKLQIKNHKVFAYAHNNQQCIVTLTMEELTGLFTPKPLSKSIALQSNVAFKIKKYMDELAHKRVMHRMHLQIWINKEDLFLRIYAFDKHHVIKAIEVAELINYFKS